MLDVREIVSLGDKRKVSAPTVPNDQPVSMEREITGKMSKCLGFTESFWQKTGLQ